MNEQEIVRRARELFSDRIGDDGAVVGDQVFTADMLVEDVDFTRDTPLASIARKSLAVNLSDLAAMGASAAYALVSLALPEWAAERVEEILKPLAESAKRYGIEIVGGDLSRGEKLTIAITAIGRIATRPLLRSGAKPGDRIYLSRPIGGSAAGLKWSRREGGGLESYAERELIESAVRRNIEPEPEIVLGALLAAEPSVSSCIDVSDGLSTDLQHVCSASSCGAEVERERIPVFPNLLELGPRLGINVRDAVLHGGEEYALLFTSSLRESELSSRLKRPVYMIGRMVSGSGVVLKENGIAQPLEARGFDHFA
jgi:thiamine-monophosphate kinase